MRSPLFTTAIVVAVALAACSSDDDATSTDVDTADTSADSSDSATRTTTVADGLAVSADAEFPAERCEANEAAGTITFLTGFDYAAAASIIEVVTADQAGYYEDLCLDVEIRPSFSTANYPLVAGGTAQFASGGSFSEVVRFSTENDADFMAATVDGRSAIDALMIKSGEASELADLEGATLGVKGALPPSIDVMLRNAGLVESESFDTVPLDGFDPIAHFAIPNIAGLPGWKSNEVGTLEREGIGVQLFDPLDFGVPGSFGAIFTSASFVEEHPTAAQDFVRATLRGLDDAVFDPEAAAIAAVTVLEENGNPNFLSPGTEIFRWSTEAELILEGTPEGMGLGMPDTEQLQVETDAYSEVGFFGDVEAPSAADFVADLAATVYDGAELVWPA